MLILDINLSVKISIILKVGCEANMSTLSDLIFIQLIQSANRANRNFITILSVCGTFRLVFVKLNQNHLNIFLYVKSICASSKFSKKFPKNNCGKLPFVNKSYECFPSFQLHYSWSFSSVFGRNKLYFYVRSIEDASLKSHRTWTLTKVYK